MSGNERSSRCHGHQQKVIASLDEFDMCPLSSTYASGFLWNPEVFLCYQGFCGNIA